MTDKELLELAAKAYWIGEIDDVVSIKWSESEQAIAYIHGENQDYNGYDVTLLWNPLEDDGDALRLAVKLQTPVFITNKISRCVFGSLSKAEECDELVGNDPYAATRRAIVRAAAAIGEKL